ncbi:MAG: phospholipase D-like domain-containing protein [Deferribacteraceae bacterium]|jgi:phosphatidylserine/phosphatidylglycerophosphate/cardiolipin synthase-like enzyme|nr:phospholipase D-like domain-containing protein [Deferribacteraceae bacterium]
MGLKKRIIIASTLVALIVFVVVANIAAAPREHTAGVDFIADDEFLPMLVHDIANAESSIVCSIYMFKTDGENNDTTKLILDSMVDALSRGVSVYILMDVGEGKDDFSAKYNEPTGKVLEEAGATVIYDDPQRRLHTKLFVLDDEITYIGSHNYTYSALKRNAESSVRIKSREIAIEAVNYIKSTATP